MRRAGYVRSPNRAAEHVPALDELQQRSLVVPRWLLFREAERQPVVDPHGASSRLDLPRSCDAAPLPSWTTCTRGPPAQSWAAAFRDWRTRAVASDRAAAIARSEVETSGLTRVIRARQRAPSANLTLLPATHTKPGRFGKEQNMTTSSSEHTAATFAPTSLDRPSPMTADQARAVFGQVMGLVAVTLGFLALGAYIGRDLAGGLGIAFFIAAIASLIGLNVASGRGRRQLWVTLLFGFGLLLGLTLGPVINAYAKADPAAVWQAAGATGAFVAALGTIGYATRRDLSSWTRVLFWALLGLIVFGIIAIFVSIPHANLIYAVAGLVIFGGYTILDFNRLRRTGIEDAVPIAASIFLDILNVFLLLLDLFGNGGE